MTDAPPGAPAAKEGFSALDTLALVRELRTLGRAWFEKAYELPGERVLVTFRVQGQGKWELLIAPGKFAFLRPSTAERPDEPGHLGMELRRQLTGAPLLSVNQPEGERYLELLFGRGGEEDPAVLAIELFGQGNVLAVRRGRITAILHVRAWAGRRLRPGEPYVRPPPRKDPFQLAPGEVMGVLSRSKSDRVSTLAARLGLGGPLSEEILSRAGLDPRAPAEQDPEPSSEALVRAMTELLQEVAEVPKGYLRRAEAGGAPLDATPYPSRRWSSIADAPPESELPRFSEAAAAYFLERSPTPAATGPTFQDRKREERSMLLRLQTQQRTAVEEIVARMQEEQSIANQVLTHYEEVQSALEAARSTTPDEAEVQVAVGDRKVPLPAWRPLRESAQALFDQAKRRLPKLEGARRALAQTEERLALVDHELASAPRPGAGTQHGGAEGRDADGEAPGEAAAPEGEFVPWRAPRRKHFWFEKAPRWMVSSEGWVAIAGRDAKSNDAVVKRYLRERDLYLHADLQGAPSVVIKRPAPGQGEIGEGTLREVAQWATSCSKAWRAGLASADAFWVEGEQVSKAGASGEFVARGSWIIHGTKHFERDLPLELSLGVLLHEGETLLQVAPPESFRGEGRRVLWKILPGDEREREQVERRISQDLGVTRERLQALLPPGGVRVERVERA